MYILGINAVFHDSAAVLIKDGKLLAAAEDERFTHIKHGKRPIPFSTYQIPYHAIDYCLSKANIHLKDVDHIAYSFDPYQLIDEHKANSPTIEIPLNLSNYQANGINPWESLFISSIFNAPGQLADGWPHHLQKRFIGSAISDWQWHFVDHHISHAASAFYPSPYRNAAVMTLDGRGEIATTTYSIGRENEMKKIGEVAMPHSLGLLYEKITTHLGFLHSSDEYKVMALASYGKPTFEKEFKEIIELTGNGGYKIHDQDLEARFGKKRLRNDAFTEHHFNIAHSMQKVLEDTVIELTNWLHEETGEENLCMAGGVALNCVMNSRVKERGKFRNIWVQPAAGDAGTALGAALWIDKQERIDKLKLNGDGRAFEMTHAYWGPEYSDKEIEEFLKKSKIRYTIMQDPAKVAAEILANNKIIGWFQGPMEFGPRALGSRSILASPIDPSMQARLNEIKDREDFRPVAPVVIEEDASEWFEKADYSPFMLFVFDVKEDKADRIPAVKHVDGTARIQTINKNQHPLYYDLLKAFKAKTGVPVLVNTSFNTLGKPIVCTPRDAVECFWSSPFDALIIGKYLVEK
jgi:carbamoyltransferase